MNVQTGMTHGCILLENSVQENIRECKAQESQVQYTEQRAKRKLGFSDQNRNL